MGRVAHGRQQWGQWCLWPKEQWWQGAWPHPPALSRLLPVGPVHWASQKRDGTGPGGMFPLGQPWGTQQGSVWKEKRCAAHRTSLHSQISWLFLCFTSHHSRVCNLLLLKAASTWNHFLVCLLAGNFSQLFYLFETRSLPVSFCLKSSILTWNPLSVLPIYAEELALEDLLILRAPFSLLDS